MSNPELTFDQELCLLIRSHIASSKDKHGALYEVVLSLVFQACQGSDKMFGIRSLSRRQIKQLIDMSYRQLDENKVKNN